MGTGISWAKYGSAFGWELATVLSMQRWIQPEVATEDELKARWKEIFPSAPEKFHPQ